MGSGDLYPFVLAPKVLEKLAFVDALVRPRARESPRRCCSEHVKPASPIDPIAGPAGHPPSMVAALARLTITPCRASSRRHFGTST